MSLLRIELVEVVLGQLHLRAVQHGEAHADEDVLDLIQGDIHGVAVTGLVGLAGDGHVQSLSLQTVLQGLGLQLLAPALQGLLQGGPDLVGQLTHGGALLGGELAHLLEDGGELTLLAQVLDPEGIQGGGVAGGLKGGQGLGADVCQLFFHRCFLPFGC